MTTNFTTEELSYIAGIAIPDSEERDNLRNHAIRLLGYSVSADTDKTTENFAKRLVYYYAPTMQDKMTAKWVKLLANRVNKFLKGNELNASEALAKAIGATPKEFKASHPDYRSLKPLYRALACFKRGEWPSEETTLGKIKKYTKHTLGVIDGRFGRYVLKPQYRRYWRAVTYSAIIILLFIYVIVPAMNFWQGIVSYLNYLRWGIE